VKQRALRYLADEVLGVAALGHFFMDVKNIQEEASVVHDWLPSFERGQLMGPPVNDESAEEARIAVVEPRATPLRGVEWHTHKGGVWRAGEEGRVSQSLARQPRRQPKKTAQQDCNPPLQPWQTASRTQRTSRRAPRGGFQASP